MAEGISYGGGVSAAGLGQDPMTDLEGGNFNPAYFGPNLEAMPEPSPWISASAIVLGLGAWKLRKRLAARKPSPGLV